jgi:FkbH-like protein
MTRDEAILTELRRAVHGQRAPEPVARRALMQADDPALVRKAGRILTRLRLEPGTLPSARVIILATCTVGSFEHLLRAVLVGAGLFPVIEVGEYGAFEMTMATGLAASSEADLVATLVDERYFLPANWSPADLGSLESHLRSRLEDFSDLVQVSLRQTTTSLLVHTVPVPPVVRGAFLSLRDRARFGRLWAEANARILRLAEEHPQVVAVDLAGEMADIPAATRDARLRHYGDMPYTDAALLALAQQVRRCAQAKLGLSRKVLALDLDNTLWGGVVGEVGAAGVELGGLYPGNCYLELQRTVQRLRDQGVVLMLASKNDAGVVSEVLATHPDMVLRETAFSVSAVNWAAKADNLRDAAQSLGLAADSFVLMDDSAFECEHVQAELPAVAVIRAAGDPAYLTDALLRPGWFDVMALTSTDRQRPELYRTRVLRSGFSAGFGSSEDFLHALGMQVEIAPATEFTISRIAQLAARTNQFNLTGIRFDEATTSAMSSDPGYLVATVSVADRFGSEGIVGALWAERSARRWRVLNLVLSCRVLGRGVEFAIAAWLERKAAKAGAGVVESSFTRTGKNSVASGFWIKAGYQPADSNGAFVRDLANSSPVVPAWICLNRDGAA